jgi:hypothetical protein
LITVTIASCRQGLLATLHGAFAPPGATDRVSQPTAFARAWRHRLPRLLLIDKLPLVALAPSPVCAIREAARATSGFTGGS